MPKQTKEEKAAYQRLYRANPENKEKARAKSAQWRKENPEWTKKLANVQAEKAKQRRLVDLDFHEKELNNRKERHESRKQNPSLVTRTKELARHSEKKRRQNPDYVEHQRSRARGRYKKTKARIALQAREERRDPALWSTIKLREIRARSRARGWECDLEVSDLMLPASCEVLNIPLILGPHKKGSRNWNSPSVDRFDNSKGYVKGNIRIISLRANFLKNNGTLEEMRAVVKYMEKTNS